MWLFLDIDGVMVPAKPWKSPEILGDGFPAFSMKAIRTLQRLISESTVLVLTTSHKSTYSIDEWKVLFKNRGLEIEQLVCLPPNVSNLSRKEEIVNWFHAHTVQEDFVIIDDDKSLNDLPDFLKEKLVQTSPIIGLTEEHLEAIRAIVSAQNSHLV